MITKEELMQQLQVNDTKVAEINAEIAKQKLRPTNTFEPRMVIREFGLQLEYWRRHRANTNKALESLR